MTARWPGDVDVAFAYLIAQPGVARGYGAGGASCGVNQSIQLSRRHPEVKSLVLLSGNTDRAGRRLCSSRSSPPYALGRGRRRGRSSMMAWIDACSANPATRFDDTKGGHGTEMFQAHPDLPGDIVVWYQATLEGKPASTPTRLAGKLQGPHPDDDRPARRVRAPPVEILNAERRRIRSSPALAAPFVNFLGYSAIDAGDTTNAIAIMQLNVDVRPGSSNAWDSLGDAYLAGGQRDRAREASENALTLVDGIRTKRPSSARSSGRAPSRGSRGSRHTGAEVARFPESRASAILFATLRFTSADFVDQADTPVLKLLNLPQLEPVATFRRLKERLPFTGDQRIDDEPELSTSPASIRLAVTRAPPIR